MTDRIDEVLHRLGAAELPIGSADFEQGVMARIDASLRARAARPSLGASLGAGVGAMIIGLASTQMAPDTAPIELSVFSANAALAPATLLAIEG